ncbi:MAG: hypothetical protein AAF335_03745, partial [Bacteroidota bacterium]
HCIPCFLFSTSSSGSFKNCGCRALLLLACRGEIESGMKSIGQEGGAFMTRSVTFTENNQVAVVAYGRFPGSSKYHWIVSAFDDDLTNTWNRNLGPWYDRQDVSATPDGGILVSGGRQRPSYQNQGLLFKLNTTSGNSEWITGIEESIDNINRSWVDTVCNLNGNIFMIGHYINQQGYTTRLNSTGHEVWTVSMPAFQAYRFSDSFATPDGGVVMVGIKSLNSLVGKLSSNGVEEWSVYIEDIVIRSVTFSLDSGYLLLGYTKNSLAFGFGDTDLAYVLVSHTGIVESIEVLGDSGKDRGYGLTSPVNGSFFGIGIIGGAPDDSILLLEWDSNRTLISQKTMYGGLYFYDYSIASSSSGRMAFTGPSDRFTSFSFYLKDTILANLQNFEDNLCEFFTPSNFSSLNVTNDMTISNPPLNVASLLDAVRYYDPSEFNITSFGINETTPCLIEVPTKDPTEDPTPFPSKTPTQTPTSFPSKTPSASPSKTPTASPSKMPSKTPTSSPSKTPTKTPTSFPSKTPTKTPTSFPSKTPTASPSKMPTKTPTSFPSKIPTKTPTQTPSSSPSKSPTQLPSTSPTATPTYTPVFIQAQAEAETLPPKKESKEESAENFYQAFTPSEKAAFVGTISGVVGLSIVAFLIYKLLVYYKITVAINTAPYIPTPSSAAV